MAVPSIASFSTKEDAANTTSRTIGKPTGTSSGDWLVLIVGMDGTGTITTSDFTTIIDTTDSIDSHRFRLAVRKADGSEGSTFTIGTSASEEVNAWLGRITGVDSGITSGNLIDALSICKASAEQSKVIAPNIWTETNDCLIIAAYTQDGGVANAAATGIPSGYTESHQDAGLAAGCGISVVYKDLATAGAGGLPVWTCSAATDEYVAVQFAIRSTTTPATAPAHPIPKCSVVNLCSSASSTFDVVLELPYGTAEDDGLILEVASESTSTTIPADFTQIQKSNTGGFIYFENAKFIADASMPSTYTVSCSATAAKTAALHLFKNIDTADFPHKNAATSGSAADTSPVAPSVTTTKANCLIWRSFGADDDDLTVGSGYFGSTTGVFSGVTGANADISQQAAYSVLASAGSAGTATATLNLAEDWVACTLAIAPGSSGVTGTASGTEEEDTGSGAGDVFITGTASGTEEEDSGSASGDVFITGTASGTEEEDTGSAAGAPSYVGTASGTEDDDTGTASGKVYISGTVSASEEDDTGSASGTIPITGTSAGTEEDDSGSASGDVFITGTGSGTEEEDTGAASGGAVVTGSASGTEDDDSGSAAGLVYIAGSVAATEEDDTGSAAGLVLITGAASGTEEDDTGTAAGTVAITGTASGSEDDDTGSAAGLVLIVGGASGTEEDDSGSADGTVESEVTGSASGTEDDDSGGAVGLVLVAGTSVATEEDDTGSATGTSGAVVPEIPIRTTGGVIATDDSAERKIKAEKLLRRNNEALVLLIAL